jgi:hypothetical protein
LSKTETIPGKKEACHAERDVKAAERLIGVHRGIA